MFSFGSMTLLVGGPALFVTARVGLAVRQSLPLWPALLVAGVNVVGCGQALQETKAKQAAARNKNRESTRPGDEGRDNRAEAIALSGWCRTMTLLLPLSVSVVACSDGGGPDPYVFMEGENIYKAECAKLPRKKLEGQPDWRLTRRADESCQPSTRWERSSPAPPDGATSSPSPRRHGAAQRT